MYKLFVFLFLLISSQKLLHASPISYLSPQQEPSVTPAQSSSQCQDVPSCRKRISDLEAEINKLRGIGTEANKSRISSLARSLRRSQSTLRRLEGNNGETQGGNASPNRRGSEQPAANLPRATLTPQNLLELLSLISTTKDEVINEQVRKTGEVYVIKNAVIGILEIKYDKSVKPDSPFRLSVTVTPKDIVEENFLRGVSETSITSYIKPEYKSQKSKVEYNLYESGNEGLERQIESGKKFTWVWYVTPPSGFESDAANLYVYAKFKASTQESNWHPVSDSVIEFKESRLDTLWTLLYNNFTYLLIVAGTVVTGFAGIKMYRAQQLSNNLNELRFEWEKQQNLFNQTQKRLLEEQAANRNLLIRRKASGGRLGQILWFIPKILTFLIALALRRHRKTDSRH